MTGPPSERDPADDLAELGRQVAGALELDRPLLFLDLEATGLDVEADRIVEIAFVRVEPGGAVHAFTTRIDPECPVPDDAVAVHGLGNAELKGAPRFADVVDELHRLLGGADLAGYNHGRYDLPLLAAEFVRAGSAFDWQSHRIVDVSVIFRRMESRSLSGAMRFYCDRELEDAHTATGDVAATMAVLVGQTRRYPDLDTRIDALDEFTRPRDPEAGRD